MSESELKEAKMRLRLDPVVCSVCKGSGRVNPIPILSKPCDNCFGTGYENLISDVKAVLDRLQELETKNRHLKWCAENSLHLMETERTKYEGIENKLKHMQYHPEHIIELKNKFQREARKKRDAIKEKKSLRHENKVLLNENETLHKVIEAAQESIITQSIPTGDAESYPSPDNSASLIEFRQNVDGILGHLTEREEKVIRLRFGLWDGIPRTLEEVGMVFLVSRERIRQMEAKAIRKLRHPGLREELIDIKDWEIGAAS